MTGRGRLAILLGRLALGGALIAAWQAAADALGPFFFAAPGDVALRLVEIAGDGTLLRHTLATLRLSLTGFVPAALLGVLIPIGLAFAPRARAALDPYVRAAMGVPPFALAPLLVLWLGIGQAPKVAIVFTVVFFLMFVATDAGVRSIDRRLVAMARVLGAAPVQLAREVLFRSTLPFVLTGMKVAVPRAVGAAIVGEILVSERGLGHYIEHSREMTDQPGMFAGVVAVTVLILLISDGLRRVEGAAMAWRPTGGERGV
jgi:NitT/TauT family transport system permease protein